MLAVKIIIGIAVFAVSAIVVVYYNAKKGIPSVKVETLTAETVIAFFKRPNVVTKLQENNNLLPVAVKEANKKVVVLCCYNSETEKIESEFMSYRYKNLDADLETLFGDKAMIVLR